MPITRNRFRYSILFGLFLLCLCIALFFYARASDQNQAEALDALNNAQLQACRRDNVLRRERNKETAVFKAILSTIVQNSEERAKRLEQQGKQAEADFTRKQSEPYQKYNDQIRIVTISNCIKVANERVERVKEQ